jgi:hypothetical protein
MAALWSLRADSAGKHARESVYGQGRASRPLSVIGVTHPTDCAEASGPPWVIPVKAIRPSTLREAFTERPIVGEYTGGPGGSNRPDTVSGRMAAEQLPCRT